jgi:chemotaxis response regulator CheB
MKRDIITIGSSAGGIDAVSSILSQLPESFEASIFVVIHGADRLVEELFEKRAAEARAHAETIRRIIIEGVQPAHREMNAE